MKRINREILSIAVPSIITNITTPLLALMDVVIVGHMGSAGYIAAIAVGGTIFNMLYWLFAFLRMGSSGLTAQANGANNKNSCDLVLARGLLVAFAASVIMLLCRNIILTFANGILEVKSDIGMIVGEYFSILIWGAPAYLGTFVLTGWFLGLKKCQSPDVGIFHNKSVEHSNQPVSRIRSRTESKRCRPGGTLSAQWIGFIVGISIAFLKYHPEFPSLNSLVNPTELKRFFSVNIDILFRTLCLIVVTVWFTRVGSTQGTVILAVNTLLMQFFILFSYFMDGFAFAGESLCGNSIGKQDIYELNSTIKALFRWSAIMVIIFTLLYAVAGEWIMTLLSDDKDVISSSKEFFAWVIAIPAVGFAAFTWDGIFIGATRTREMLISIAIATLVYFALYSTLSGLLAIMGCGSLFLLTSCLAGLYSHSCAIGWSRQNNSSTIKGIKPMPSQNL